MVVSTVLSVPSQAASIRMPERLIDVYDRHVINLVLTRAGKGLVIFGE